MLVREVKLAEKAVEKLSAGAAFQEGVTLSPEETLALLKWVKSEKYRHLSMRRASLRSSRED